MFRLFLTFIASVFLFTSYSQEKIVVSPFIIVDGERILTSEIPQLDIIDFKDNIERKSFFRLRKRVLKVYPYAI